MKRGRRRMTGGEGWRGGEREGEDGEKSMNGIKREGRDGGKEGSR